MSKYQRSASLSSSEELFLVPRSQKIVKIGAILVLVLIVAGGAILGGLSIYSSQFEKADSLFAKALEIYEAPLIEKGHSKEDIFLQDVPRFEKAEERTQASLKLLEQLERDFPKSPAADLGKLMQAQILLEQGKTKEAQDLYQKLRESKIKDSSMLSSVLFENQAISLELQKKATDAEKIYTEQVAKIPTFYQPFFYLDQALLQTELGKTKEAKEAYQKASQNLSLPISFRALIDSAL